jgi:putative holliday junction resolvase
VRFLGVDFGRKRIGLALSDPAALLARPWQTIPAESTPLGSAASIAALLDSARDPLDDASLVGGIVVGLPRRLDGSDTTETQIVRDLAAALRSATGLAVHLQDERLTSREAEARLAEREPDWRRRKAKLDSAAAAIILQDFLDGHPRSVNQAAPTSW